MTVNQVRTLYNDRGQGFGLGFAVVERLGADGFASAGTFSWGGAYSSIYKVDPQEGLVMVFMVQMLPSRTDVPAKFPTLVYQALVDDARRP
jgi:CubicO group peptidase (beta-lactamase class C family)